MNTEVPLSPPTVFTWDRRERPPIREVAQAITAKRQAALHVPGGGRRGQPLRLRPEHEDGPVTFECRLPTRFTPERGEGSYACIGGHDHVPAEIRYDEGWDYTDDPAEAAGMMGHGVYPVQPDGKSWF